MNRKFGADGEGHEMHRADDGPIKIDRVVSLQWVLVVLFAAVVNAVTIYIQMGTLSASVLELIGETKKLSAQMNDKNVVDARQNEKIEQLFQRQAEHAASIKILESRKP